MPATVNKRQAYSNLLDGFMEVHDKTEREELAAAQRLKKKFGPLFDGFGIALEGYWRRQKKTADDFNLLAVFNLESDEIRHSKALAWLLNCDPRAKGTHYQGNLGFQAFLEEFGLDASYAKEEFKVECEPVENESRLDIRIVSRDCRWLIGIEVKIWASEGEKQTVREWRDLCDRAERKQIPRNCIHAFFLTPYGTKAGSENFYSITWRRIAKVFMRFANELGDGPKDVVLFARHCACAMERLSPPTEEPEEQ